jgi:hypothetical protein
MDFELDPTAVKQVAPARKRPPVPCPPANPTLRAGAANVLDPAREACVKNRSMATLEIPDKVNRVW